MVDYHETRTGKSFYLMNHQITSLVVIIIRYYNPIYQLYEHHKFQ